MTFLHSRWVRTLGFVPLLVIPVGCEPSSALGSDPRAWSPNRLELNEPNAVDASRLQSDAPDSSASIAPIVPSDAGQSGAPAPSDVGEVDAAVGPALDAARAAPTVVPCVNDPAYDEAVVVSSAQAISHAAGLPCLLGCHETGGSAKLTFAAAGTAYEAQGSRKVAAPGKQVRGVGGTTLQVDACGNFFVSEAELAAKLSASQPFVLDPVLRKMEKPMSRVSRPGDCNQSGCHDFSARTKVGIYF